MPQTHRAANDRDAAAGVGPKRIEEYVGRVATEADRA